MDLAMEAGLSDLADVTVLDNLADYQTSRGTDGNYQKALITQRREWEEKGKEEKKQGFLSKVMKGKRKEVELEQMAE